MDTPYHQQLSALADLLRFTLPTTPFNSLQLKFNNRACVMRSQKNGNGIFVECRLNTPEAMDMHLRNRAAMQANYCFVQSRGATLALDIENRLVLQQQFDLEGMTVAQFQKCLENFLNTASQLDDAYSNLDPEKRTDITQFSMRI